MDDDDEDILDVSDRRGIVLTNIEANLVAEMLNAREQDRVRVVWQNGTPIIWAMRMRPLEFDVAD